MTNVKVTKGLNYKIPDTNTAINVLRKYGAEENKHYGNPFGTNDYGSKAEVPNEGNDTEVSQKYEDWLKGTYRQDVAPERRNWIVEQIESGKLDGKELMYFRDAGDNHAKRLANLVNDKDWIKPATETTQEQTKVGAEFGSKSKIKDTVYHYAQSGTIDPTLKTNSKEKALFFFKNRKSAELLQEALNQGKPDKTGKIFEAKINLVNPREVDATDHDTGKLIEETIDADKSGNDGIIAHNMTEFFVGVDDQYGVFDIEKNVQFLNLEEKQTSTTKNNIKELGKKLNYKDIEQLLETYGNDRDAVIGDEVGYVGEHDTKFKINYRQKIRTMDGEVWDAIGLNGRDIAVLKNTITQLNKYRVHSQLTKPQQRVLKVMTDLTHEQLAEIIENSEYAAGASLGYNPNNYQETNDNRTVQMNAMHVREKIMADNEHWKLYTKDKAYTGKHDKYYGALGELINKIVKPNQVEVPGLLLKAISDGNFGMATVAEYNYITHTIGISTKPTEAEMEQAVIDGLTSKYVLDNNIASDQVMKNFGNIAKYVDKHQAKMLQNVMQSVASVKGPHAVTHELIHAGALNYMRANPEAEATLRINELYQEALVNKDKIQRLAYSGDVFSTYWEKNVEEFLAEAMSNPGLMYALSQTKTDGKKKLSKGMLRELVDTLLDMLGLSPKVKDNILEYVMDGFAAIIEAQADKVPVGLEIDSETKAMLMAKLNELKEQNGTIHLEDRAASEKADIERLKDC